MPALTPEDLREQERRVGRAERQAAATGSAEAAAAEDAYWAGFRSLAAGLREGREAPDVRYGDDAEDAGDAYGGIAPASPEAVRAMILEAGPQEARHLRAAARERERRLAEDPAAFVLGNTRVRAAHDAWRAALTGDDPDAIARTARAYAQASLDEQRRLGVAEAERRVLPAESAAAMVTIFTAAERPDPAALGAELRQRFGEHWRPVLEDLKAAGLPEGMAAIAAMDRPDQQAAAQRLSALAGTSTAELRARVDEGDVETVDRTLRAAAPELATSGAMGTDDGAQTALIQRRAFDLIAAGEAAGSAAITAAAELLTKSPAEAAAFKQSAPKRLAAVPKPPADQQSPDIIDAALPSASEVDRSLVMSEEIEEIAGRLGLDPKFLPPDSDQLRDLLRDLDGFESLSPEEQERIDVKIRALQDNPPQFWIPIREKYSELRRMARQALDEPAEPAENALLLENRFEEFRSGPEDRRQQVSRQRALDLGPQWWSTPSERIREANIAWLNDALVNGDEQEREFAVKAVLEADQLSLDVQQILSEESIQSYVDFWRSSYERGAAIDVSTQSDSSMRFKDLIETGVRTHDLPISNQAYRELLARISQVPHATREQRMALAEYIANVVTPFSEIHGLNLQRAVSALSVGRENGVPRLIDIPGQYVEFLTNRDLADYSRARGFELLDSDRAPHVPDSFMEHVGAIGFAGAAVSAASVLTDPSVGSVVGATLSVADIANSADEHNRELGDFYTRRELYFRLRFGLTSKDMTVQIDRAIPPDAPPTFEERTSDSVTGNTSLQ